MPTYKTAKLKQLAKALLSFKQEKEMLHFLRDLCTLEELDELSSRWEVVQFLADELSYREISKKTGVSTATITRIAHWLKEGEGGYTKALEIKKKR